MSQLLDVINDLQLDMSVCEIQKTIFDCEKPERNDTKEVIAQVGFSKRVINGDLGKKKRDTLFASHQRYITNA